MALNMTEERSPESWSFTSVWLVSKAPVCLPLNTVREMEAIRCTIPELLPHTLKFPLTVTSP